MNIVICDDQIEYTEIEYNIIKNYLKEKNICVDIQKYTSGSAMLNECDLKKIDILFLDVEMDEKNGMEIAEEIRGMKLGMYIVYVSAYIKYASDGYKYDAFRYVLKNNLLQQGIEESLDSILNRKMDEDKKILFSFIDGNKTLSIYSLQYIESMGHKLSFYVYEKEKIKKYEMYGKLSTFEKELKLYGFERVHQSFLVNMHHVISHKRYEIELKSGQIITIPRARYNEVVQMICKYIGE